MRELHEIEPMPTDPEDILRFGLHEIATSSSGHHLDPENVCYGVKRDYQEYAQRILKAAKASVSG
jgi:hypothetical protein